MLPALDRNVEILLRRIAARFAASGTAAGMAWEVPWRNAPWTSPNKYRKLFVYASGIDDAGAGFIQVHGTGFTYPAHNLVHAVGLDLVNAPARGWVHTWVGALPSQDISEGKVRGDPDFVEGDDFTPGMGVTLDSLRTWAGDVFPVVV